MQHPPSRTIVLSNTRPVVVPTAPDAWNARPSVPCPSVPISLDRPVAHVYLVYSSANMYKDLHHGPRYSLHNSMNATPPEVVSHGQGALFKAAPFPPLAVDPSA